MFKLGFASLILVFLSCNVFESSPAKFPEKQKNVIPEDEGGRKLEKDGDAFAEDADYDNAELPRDESDDENGEDDDVGSETNGDESKKQG